LIDFLTVFSLKIHNATVITAAVSDIYNKKVLQNTAGILAA